MPRMQRHEVNKMLDTANAEIGQAKPRGIKKNGKGRQVADPLLVEQVDRPVNKEWADQMQFSAELVTFSVMPASEKNAEDPVYCANNGDLAPVSPRPGWLYRNQEYTLQRRFLESLLRAKIITYTQRKEADPAGVQQIVNIPNVACRYQIRVVRDVNPLGNAWFKHVMMEAP